MCAQCRSVPKRFRAKAGYDLRRVPETECLHCKKPIGKAAFVEIKVLARFGQMIFAHSTCDADPRNA